MLSGAIKKNQSIRRILTTFLNKKGFDAKSITSSKFSSTPEYGFFGNKPDNYKVNNIILIKIQSEKEFLSISEAVDKHEQVFLAGTSFEHSEHKEYEKKVLANAIENALSKKILYEKTLATKLHVTSISENTTSFMPQNELGSVKGKRFASYANNSQTNFGVLTYQSTVSIKYKVEHNTSNE
jgi:uncharacterized protein YggE